LSEKIHKWLHVAEDSIYFVVGLMLIGAAVAMLGWSIYDFIQMALDGKIGEAVLRTLDSLLLVVMLVEILHTVGMSMRGNMLVIEPFMVVGIIAAVRRILVVTAEQANPSAEHATEFQMAMLELGILTFMIVALVGAVALVRRFAPRNTEEKRAIDGEEPERELVGSG
jgi:uncharacterized membrane protein (DUF373 family)